jgi:hypothetical protein
MYRVVEGTIAYASVDNGFLGVKIFNITLNYGTWTISVILFCDLEIAPNVQRQIESHVTSDEDCLLVFCVKPVICWGKV